MKPKLCLLIVDDEPDIRDLWREEAEGWGYTALTADDGIQAFAILSDPRHTVHAVLSDINMPHLDGLSLLRKVRESGRATPFIFLTGYADKEKSVTALKLGAFDFFEKPFDLARLSDALQRAAEFGAELLELDQEVGRLSQAAGVPSDQLGHYHEALRELLKMKKFNSIRATKKTAS